MPEIIILNRSHYIAAGLVALVTVAMLSLPEAANARLKLGIGSLFLPLFGLASSSQHLAAAVEDTVTSRRELLRRNAALRRENEELQSQALRWEALENENRRLRELLGWQQSQRWKLVSGRVILREPANWWRTVAIDLGSRNGVRENMPVLTRHGLVGRIGSVALTRSQVVLLGDPNCRVAARVENPSRDTGVVGPGGPLDRGFVELGFLAPTTSLKPGQIVKTSGNGGIFPRDIPIGAVVDFQTVESGLATVARVKLAVDLNALDEVSVLLTPGTGAN